MRILFTGASSFTGYWFVRALASQGHHVTATFSRPAGAYADVRGQRVQGLAESCERVFECTFGSKAFFDVVSGGGPWDVLCHHAADATDYRSASFDYAAALEANTHRLGGVLTALSDRGCARVCLTGSVFEAGEGAGSDGQPAFSPYGLSKELTARAFQYFCGRAGFHLGKFVIANPFGPFEEPRFTAYLMKTWAGGALAEVRTPDYIRDNIHVDLLAGAYCQFVTALPAECGFSRLNPSGYVESQGRFAERFARAMADRLGLECRLALALQTDFEEPRMRVNTDPVMGCVDGWSESAAWDAVADYYRPLIQSPPAAST